MNFPLKDVRDQALVAKAWPFEEARKLLSRIERQNRAGKPAERIVFETGYGPSGLPHIGTFGEVARTSWVRQAFEAMSDVPTHLIAFSDDMDGLRKVPENLPQAEMIASNLGKPLTAIPDPFGTHPSFGDHMNARLRAFLDHFGFRYEFMSSTQTYKSGAFDAALLRILARYDEVMKVMLPTLGEERQQTYSPFLPVSPHSGKVLLAKVVDRDVAKGTITYVEEDGGHQTVPVTGGHCKLQWKPDFGMRWAALHVDYEMYGKDHLAQTPLYDAICKIADGTPPEHFVYELFLDDKGQKISKSKGNGITIEEWLSYGPSESLALFMFQKPRAAKRLHFDVIPKAVDEYIAFLDAYHAASDAAQRLENPVWFIHAGNVPAEKYPVSFALMLNLVSASGAHNRDVLWGFIRAYAPEASPERNPGLERLVGYALRYYEDFVKPAKQYRGPDEKERAALEELAGKLEALGDERDGTMVQNVVYEVGKSHGFEPLRAWFAALYEVLFGQTAGPRFGSFAALFGCAETAALIRRALDGEFLKMKAALLALVLSAAPAGNNALFTLYAQGHYEEAMRQGAAAGTATGLAIAARAAMADAMMKSAPCLDCLKRGETYARRAIAMDQNAADGHVWLAAALGYEARIVGLMRARFDNDPAQAKEHLDAALKLEPDNAYALAALGGWNVEIVRTGGKFLAHRLYDANLEQGIGLFDHAVRSAPRNVAVRYQIALSLAGLDPEAYRSRIEAELEAAIHASPETTYEKFVQGRAEELLALLKRGDRDAFDAKLRTFQGYP